MVLVWEKIIHLYRKVRRKGVRKIWSCVQATKRQDKFAEMIIMNVNTPAFLPYFDKVKMLVGITKQKKDAKKIQYSITAIEPVE